MYVCTNYYHYGITLLVSCRCTGNYYYYTKSARVIPEVRLEYCLIARTSTVHVHLDSTVEYKSSEMKIYELGLNHFTVPYRTVPYRSGGCQHDFAEFSQ